MGETLKKKEIANWVKYHLKHRKAISLVNLRRGKYVVWSAEGETCHTECEIRSACIFGKPNLGSSLEIQEVRFCSQIAS